LLALHANEFKKCFQHKLFWRILKYIVTCTLWDNSQQRRTLPTNQQQRNNGSDQRFLCGLSQGNNRGSRVLFAVCFVEVFSLWSVHRLYKEGRLIRDLLTDWSSVVTWLWLWVVSSELRLQSGWRELISDGRGCQKSCSCNSELWTVYTVIVCNCVWSNNSSCESNTRLQ
jgi:hypothetical protein